MFWSKPRFRPAVRSDIAALFVQARALCGARRISNGSYRAVWVTLARFLPRRAIVMRAKGASFGVDVRQGTAGGGELAHDEHQLSQRVAGERIEHHLALFLAAHHARGAQYAQLMGERGLVDVQHSREVAHAHLGDGQRGNDAQSAGVGERVQHVRHVGERAHGRHILAHQRFGARVEQYGRAYARHCFGSNYHVCLVLLFSHYNTLTLSKERAYIDIVTNNDDIFRLLLLMLLVLNDHGDTGATTSSLNTMMIMALLIGGNDGNSSGGTSGSVFPD